jgi:hypothetical protein
LGLGRTESIWQLRWKARNTSGGPPAKGVGPKTDDLASNAHRKPTAFVLIFFTGLTLARLPIFTNFTIFVKPDSKYLCPVRRSTHTFYTTHLDA